MIYKYINALLLVTTVTFAGLYFTERNAKVEQLSEESSEEKVKLKKMAENTSPLESQFNKIEANFPKVVYKDRIIFEGRELTAQERKDVDRVRFLYENFVRNRTHGIKKRHEMLFKRLNLNEEESRQLAKLMVDRNVVSQIDIDKELKLELAEEEREEFEIKKIEMREDLDAQIADFLGDEYEVFIAYKEKQIQYDIIRDFSDDMVKQGDFDISKQDELADYMYQSRKSHEMFFENDEIHLRQSKESAEQFLKSVRERYDEMIANAPVSEGQQQVLANFLNGVYRRYEKTAAYYEKVRQNPDIHRKHKGRHRHD